MNKSRRMMARLGHALAERGVAVCLPDLYGTGDSEGDFAEADWAVWRQDLALVAQWLAQQGCTRLSLGGLRAGCLLALDAAADLPLAPSDYLLWQPMAKGAQQLTQFLRLRMAASLSGEARETVGDLRQRLADGESLEVAGYDLNPALATALEQRELAQLIPAGGAGVHWLELSASGTSQPMQASRQVIESWREQGCAPRVQCLQGDAFWSTQELADAPALLTASLAALAPEGAV